MPLVQSADNPSLVAKELFIPANVAAAVSLTPGILIAYKDEKWRTQGMLLSPSDFQGLHLAVERSISALYRRQVEGVEGMAYREVEVLKRPIPDYLKTAVEKLEVGVPIAIFTSKGSSLPQSILLHPAEYELLRAAEALPSKAPLYRKRLEQHEDEWQQTLSW